LCWWRLGFASNNLGILHSRICTSHLNSAMGIRLTHCFTTGNTRYIHKETAALFASSGMESC
jgi:hypothetical protein